MRYSLLTLIIVVFVFAILAMAVGAFLNSPAHRMRAAGVNYDASRTGGKFLYIANGSEVDDQKLAEIVNIVREFPEAHAIGISSASVTDKGFQVFRYAPKISSIWICDLDVSEEILEYLTDMPDLVFLTIEDCPKIDKADIREFQKTNPSIKVDTF